MGVRLCGVDDGGDFVVCHRLMTGDGEFLSVNLLGEGQGKVIPRGITALFVGRNGVMYLRLDAFFREETL